MKNPEHDSLGNDNFFKIIIYGTEPWKVSKIGDANYL